MTTIYPSTPRRTSVLAFSTFQTRTSFTARTATTTKPTDDNTAGSGRRVIDLIDLFGEGRSSANLAKIQLLGEGADTNTAQALLIGWQRIGSEDIWVPQDLARLTATLGAGQITIGETAYQMAKSITAASGEGAEGTDLVVAIAKSQAAVAAAVADLLDFELLEIQCHTDSSATSANAIISVF